MSRLDGPEADSPPLRPRRVTRRDVQRFASALAGSRRRSVLRVLLDGPVVWWVLRRRGLRPLLQGRPVTTVRAAGTARTVAEAVDAGLAVLPMRWTCLRRSVVLMRELDRLLIASTLHIGVRRGASGIEAHAWVVVADAVVNDEPRLVATYAEISAGQAERIISSFA